MFFILEWWCFRKNMENTEYKVKGVFFIVTFDGITDSLEKIPIINFNQTYFLHNYNYTVVLPMFPWHLELHENLPFWIISFGRPSSAHTAETWKTQSMEWVRDDLSELLLPALLVWITEWLEATTSASPTGTLPHSYESGRPTSLWAKRPAPRQEASYFRIPEGIFQYDITARM